MILLTCSYNVGIFLSTICHMALRSTLYLMKNGSLLLTRCEESCFLFDDGVEIVSFVLSCSRSNLFTSECSILL